MTTHGVWITARRGSGPRVNLDSSDLLTRREARIMLMAAQGCNNQESADQLGLSVNTIKTHLRRIFGKLDVANRTEAVAVLMLDDRFRNSYATWAHGEVVPPGDA
jgi:DNA-binding CsgD family transcriptional regulator